VLDPGHGGSEIGAQYTFAVGTVISEKDLNLRVALKVADKLTRAGYRPILTRTADTQVNSPPKAITGRYPIGLDDDLQARVDIANNAGAKLFLSIHFNGHPSTAKQGSEVYYCAEGAYAQVNQRFASLVLKNLQNGLAGAGYQVEGRVRQDVEALRPGEHFFVLSPASDIVVRPIAMPAALAEGLFLTNEEDATALRSDATLDAIAQSYAQAIHQYFAGNSATLPTRQNTSSANATRPLSANEGLIVTDAGIGAKLRSEPTTSSEILASLSDGAIVTPQRMVKGESVNDGDDRWYLVNSDGGQGYVYAALIQTNVASGSNTSGTSPTARLGTVQTDAGAGAVLRAEATTSRDVGGGKPGGSGIGRRQ
jgi:N-acetylmuramoyl-L-alanine amidase